jgi:dihydroorotase (multifunctional complex type)
MAGVDLVFRGATVVSPRGRARRDVHVVDGRVVDVGGAEVDARTTVDASGLLLMPGFVDTHVHLMDPGPTEREDFPSGTHAAALRGVTTIVEHTHGHPVREPDDLVDKCHHLRDRAHVDFGLAAHAWPDRIDRIPELWRAGVTFFKIFTCTTHGVPGFDAGLVLAAFEQLASVGAPTLVHCEDESITERAEHVLRAAGRTDGAIVNEWRSREAERAAVAVLGVLAETTGVRATVAHVSDAAVAELIGSARRRGADVIGEACPQYLMLREHEVLDQAALRKFTPPVRARSDADEARMWELIRSGALTHVSSDHAPSTLEQKREGGIWDVHFGLPGLDTTALLLLDAAMRGELSFEDVVRVYAETPARRYGLHPRKGHLGAGADADVVLFDPSGEWTLSDADIVSKAAWTPYAGRQVRGRIVGTWLRGLRVAEEGRLTEGQQGRFLPGSGATPA